MNLKSLLLASVSLVLAPGAVHAQSNGAAPIELDPVVVEGKGRGGIPGVINTTGYVATSGRSATKTDTPLLEVPQSVSTVTQPQLEERKPQNLLEAIAYTPGPVVGMYGFDSRYDEFMIRGIDMTNTGVFRDGLRQLNSPNGLFRLEPYGVEAISILRGPAASIYGASSTGGIVDIISKRPTETPFREIELQTGSFGRLQGNFDLSGPLDAENTVFYRLTGVIRNASAEISAGRDDRVFIAPAITWKPNDKTKLTVLGEYMDSTVGGTQAYLNTYAPYVDGQGNVTEGAGFNVFAVKNNVITTPERGVFEGMTRRTVMELAGEAGVTCEVRPLPIEELREADEIFISSSAGGIMPVTVLDDRIYGNGKPGPVTNRIHDLYWAAHREGPLCTVVDYGAAA